MTGFYDPSPEVAEAGADLARVPHPHYVCPCGFETPSSRTWARHRSDGVGSIGQSPAGCQASWRVRDQGELDEVRSPHDHRPMYQSWCESESAEGRRHALKRLDEQRRTA